MSYEITRCSVCSDGYLGDNICSRCKEAIARDEAMAAEDAAVDPRDPDHSREGIFVLHNCYRCKDGALPCVQGAPNRCEFPHARND